MNNVWGCFENKIDVVRLKVDCLARLRKVSMLNLSLPSTNPSQPLMNKNLSYT